MQLLQILSPLLFVPLALAYYSFATRWARGPALPFLAPGPVRSAGALASTLGLRVIEGNPDSPVGALPHTFGDTRLALRMEGVRDGRRVRLVHFLERIHDGQLMGRRWTERVDCRMLVELASAGEVELIARPTAGQVVGRLAQPEITLGVPDLDARFVVRASDARLARVLAAALAPLGQVPFGHITLDRGALTLHEHRGSQLLALHAEMALPLLLDAARTLDASAEEAPTLEHAPFPSAVRPREEGLGEVVGIGRVPLPRVLFLGCTGAFLIVCALFVLTGSARHALATAAVCAGLGAATIALAVADRRTTLVLREHGFEWTTWSQHLATRYDAVESVEPLVHRGGGRIELGLRVDGRLVIIAAVDGVERLAQVLATLSPCDRASGSARG